MKSLSTVDQMSIPSLREHTFQSTMVIESMWSRWYQGIPVSIYLDLPGIYGSDFQGSLMHFWLCEISEEKVRKIPNNGSIGNKNTGKYAPWVYIDSCYHYALAN